MHAVEHDGDDGVVVFWESEIHPLSHVRALVPIVKQARSEAHPLGLLTAALGSGFIAK